MNRTREIENKVFEVGHKNIAQELCVDCVSELLFELEIELSTLRRHLNRAGYKTRYNEFDDSLWVKNANQPYWGICLYSQDGVQHSIGV